MRVGCDHRLVTFVLLPGNVTGMMVGNQYRPLGSRFLVTRGLPRAPLDDTCSRFRLPERIGSRIDRVGQQFQNCRVYRKIPDRLPTWLIEDPHWQFNALPAKPWQDLTNAAQF